jgi:hypothetical protein
LMNSRLRWTEGGRDSSECAVKPSYAKTLRLMGITAPNRV